MHLKSFSRPVFNRARFNRTLFGHIHQKHWLLAIALACLSAGPTIGQDVQVLTFEGAVDGTRKGEPADFQQSRFAIGGPSSLSIGAGPMLLGGAGFGVDPNNRSALFNLLSNQSVRRELQLKEVQYAGVQKIMQESQKRMNETVRSNMAAGNNNIGAGLTEMMAERRQAAEVAIEEILLPEQLTRIRQLAYQVEIAQLGLGESLTTGRLGSEIDIHNDQKQHLADKAAAIEIETRAAIAKIRAAAREKLFAELVPEQRKKAEELIGPHFEYEESNFAKVMHERKKPTTPSKP